MPLAVPTVSLSTFFLHDPIRRFTAAQRLPRSSPRDLPPSEEHEMIDIHPEFISPEKNNKELRKIAQCLAADLSESFAPPRRRQMTWLRRDSLKTRPLWKGIVFASKKVRSIILLIVITVIYVAPCAASPLVIPVQPCSNLNHSRLQDILAARRRDLRRKERSLLLLLHFTPVKEQELVSFRFVFDTSDIPVLKEVEQIVDPALFSVGRFAVTTIPFLPFMLKESLDSQTRSDGIELGFCVSLGYLTQALGLLTSEAGRASFISAFTIIVVPLIDGIFGATVPALTWYGALVSLVGVAMLEYGGSLCMDAMCDVSATETAIIYGLQPVWGAAFAWFFLGERWEKEQF
ncbi:hypothetical protein KSP40_PGU018565 [Platanthera guangdongensis]|uniref:EamA domain-containing protein n=1 Tax=Platanthera guangdongensis TaxID=2320717 RepID=A0ABR2MZV2_9ASPA